MFVPHLEEFDFFVTLKTCGFPLRNGFLCRPGMGEVKNQEKNGKERNEK
jgi:hypothetical protein